MQPRGEKVEDGIVEFAGAFARNRRHIAGSFGDRLGIGRLGDVEAEEIAPPVGQAFPSLEVPLGVTAGPNVGVGGTEMAVEQRLGKF